MYNRSVKFFEEFNVLIFDIIMISINILALCKVIHHMKLYVYVAVMTSLPIILELDPCTLAHKFGFGTKFIDQLK